MRFRPAVSASLVCLPFGYKRVVSGALHSGKARAEHVARPVRLPGPQHRGTVDNVENVIASVVNVDGEPPSLVPPHFSQLAVLAW